jgi:WD40 repeat protein
MADHARSRAVLIGTGTYRYLPGVRPALNSVARMESLLTGDLCGWPPNRVVTFLDRRQPGELPDQLVELYEDAEDVALFYYVGHGQIDPSDTLCLGLVESREVATRRKTTSLPFDAVRNALVHSPAKAKIVILDCCYAGLAAPGTMAASGVFDLIRGTGAYTMAAAGEFSRAWFETDEGLPSPQTYFTKYLVDVIERGIPGQGLDLSLEAIFREVVEELARAGKPIPTSGATGHAAQFPFAGNAAARSAAEATGDTARWAQVSPYRGLSAFGQDQAEVFYGRERLTAQLVESLAARLDGAGVLVVSGASGAGKSSLLHAGLLPALRSGMLTAKAAGWPVRTMIPTAAPGEELARVLAEVGDGDPLAIRRSLETAPEQAHVLVREAVGPDRRLLLVVDQFERVFTLLENDDGRQRRAFIAALTAAATQPYGPSGQPAALVVIAVRSDFLAACATHPELTDSLQDGLFLVGPMSESDLRRTITGPAQKAGLRLEPGLVDTILSDLPRSTGGDYEAGALPLLSQAMRVTWEHREGDWLTSRAYGLSGGVAQAVQNSAEATYAALTPQQQTVARQVFHRMTKVTRDVQAVRRPMPYLRPLPSEPRAEWADVEAVVEAFAGHRLLVVQHETAEIAHDVLLHAWARLRDWLEDDQTNRALYGELLDDAEDWDRNGRAASYLYRGVRLAAVRQAVAHWLADTDRYPALTGTPRAFLDASVQAENRGRRQRRVTFATLSGLLAVALVLSGVALFQGRTARDQERIATARQLVAKAEAALDSDPRTALRLNVAAHRIHPDAETYASLQTAMTTTPYAGQLTGVNSQVSSLAYSANSRYLAAGFVSGAMMLWDLRDPLRPRQVGEPFAFQDFSGNVTVAFTSGDSRLVAVSSSGAVTIWDLADPGHPRPLGHPKAGDQNAGGGAWLSPDATVLATSSKKNPRLQLWDLTDPARIRSLGPPLAVYPTQVSALAFSADGTMIATAGRSHEVPVTLWDIRHRAKPRLLGRIAPKPADIAGSLSFSPDGKTLAIGGDLRGTGLWNVSEPANPRPARDLIRVQYFSKVRFSPHGTTLVTTGDRDTGLLLWDTANPDLPRPSERLIAGENDVTMAFSPDGRRVASGSTDGSVTLWNLERAGRPRVFGPPFVGHKGEYQEVYALAMSEDGTMIATGGRDTIVALWDLADPARPRQLATLKGHTGEGVDAVGFAPDSKILATGDGKGTVILWDLADRDHPRRLDPSLTGPTNIVRSILFSADGKTLIVGGDQATIFWDVREPTRPRRLAQVLDKEGVLGVWRVRDGRLLAVVRGSGTYTTPSAVAAPTISPTGSGGQAAQAGPATRPSGGPGNPNGIRLWDITDPAHPRRLGRGLVGHNADVGLAALSPKGDLLLTSDRNGTAILWDVKDPVHARRLGDPLVPHGSTLAINAVFAPSTDIMVTGGVDGNAYLWDLGNRILPRKLGTALADNLDAIGHMVFSSNGQTLATAGSRGDVVLWDLRPTYELRAHLVDTTCRVTNGGLDRDQWSRYLSGLAYQDTCAR